MKRCLPNSRCVPVDCAGHYNWLSSMHIFRSFLLEIKLMLPTCHCTATFSWIFENCDYGFCQHVLVLVQFWVSQSTRNSGNRYIVFIIFVDVGAALQQQLHDSQCLGTTKRIYQLFERIFRRRETCIAVLKGGGAFVPCSVWSWHRTRRSTICLSLTCWSGFTASLVTRLTKWRAIFMRIRCISTSFSNVWEIIISVVFSVFIVTICNTSNTSSNVITTLFVLLGCWQ